MKLEPLLLALVICASAGQGQEADSAAMAQDTPAPAPVEAEKPKDPIVCKRVTQSHTRISSSQRTCLPKSQWDIQNRELDEMQRRLKYVSPRNSG